MRTGPPSIAHRCADGDSGDTGEDRSDPRNAVRAEDPAGQPGERKDQYGEAKAPQHRTHEPDSPFRLFSAASVKTDSPSADR